MSHRLASIEAIEGKGALPATWRQRIGLLLLNTLVFTACYQTANHLAERAQVSRQIALAFERQIPFIAWMVLPYLCSGLFYAGSFFLVPDRAALRLLSQRLLLATVVAALVFAALPVQCGFVRPAVQSPVLALLYAGLGLVDRPYNQIPSLHVAYCVVFWFALRDTLDSRPARWLLAVALLLVSVATVFTYQHQSLDGVAGALLGLAVVGWVRPGSHEVPVALHYVAAATVTFLVGALALHSLLGLYLTLSLLLVSVAYARRDRQFLHKRSGRHPLWVWGLYAPYLAGYRLTWWLVQWRERHHAPVVRVSERLWIGRRLTDREAALLPPDCVVVDLSAELPETPSLLRAAAIRYRHLPLLDLVTPAPAAVEEIAAVVRAAWAEGRIVYLHCAMGYERCVRLADYLA